MNKTIRIGLSHIMFLRRFLLITAGLIIFTVSVFGQGTVRGVITGTDVNEPLLAATVVVKGTTTGTVTNHNGEFAMALRPGSYTLQISYVGYETTEQEITVESNQITEMNISLAPATILGEEAVITAQARGQLAAVNQQLRSNQIVNVVSSERIKELPDANAAQAVSRLPGIHLDGSRVVVRGVQAKMNKILINGVEMPSTEANNRASSIGMISSNMLSGIEVFKTLTPDMDANAVGGVVNLRLREAPEGLHYNLRLQGAYNQQEKLMGNYKIWADISNRFFNNRLGFTLNVNYDVSNGGSDRVSMNYGLLEQGTIGEGRYMFNTLSVYDDLRTGSNYGGTAILDYKLPNGKLIYSSMLTQSNNDNTSHWDMMGIGSTYHHIHLIRSKSSSLLLNNSLRYEQQISIVKLDASASYISMESDDDFRYWMTFEDQAERAFYIDSITVQKRLNMQPWEAYKYVVPTAWEGFRSRRCELTPRYSYEKQLLADLNLQIPLSISDQISVNFKTGGKYKQMNREYDRAALEYYQDFVPIIHRPIKDWLVSIGHVNWESELYYRHFRDYDYKTNDGFMNGHDWYSMPLVIDVELMDKMFVELVNPKTLPTISRNSTDDYWGGENLYAGYAMAELSLGNRLLIIPGIRYERVDNNYSAYKVEEGSMTTYFIRDTLNKPATHENWLPHLHLRYKLTDWWDIRLSFNKTLSRPDYNYAVPSVFYDPINASGNAGNPYIGPAESENLDANFTFYSKRLGLLTIGGFIKRIDDIFYRQPTLLKNIPDSSIINEFPVETYSALLSGTTNFYLNSPYRAELRGIEVEWQSNLSYLPSPFNGLVLNANYTRVWSETKYMQHRVDKVGIPTFPFVEEVERDTFFVNRLIDQANDIGNVSLGYDYKGFSARVSFRFQGNVINGIASRPEENSYTSNIYRYDFVMKQRIPFRFANFEAFFHAINFTNVPNKAYQIFPNKGETTTSISYSGRTFQLGLRLTK